MERKQIIYSLIIFIILLADRLMKILIQNKTKNYGAAFGILQGYTLLFIIVAIVFIIFIPYYIRRVKSELLRTSLVLILAGTIGNLIDRLFFGYVIDIIKLSFMPAFNIADFANTTGAILLIIYLMKKK